MAKNRYLAALLSFIVAGLGQLYVGRYWRALAFILLDVITSYFFIRSDSNVALAVNLIVTVISMVDAYHLAGQIQQTQPTKEKPAAEEQKIQIKAY